ncbi:metal ABC transporter ATP-binding protein [Conexibacter woesei]|uniref:ABC transporter related protein n=1 Tax=Conexibacter woesei (strain DSM 14684 / CCUG 47730 / CIP 108061 / JCM 11494 / NBRC 100937 / ID131577) TaxID=469383 RepID=D3F1X7_CONWI|nr:metal ABC transporter ATP-binding protein [Conexibacter woesei]ADB54158.1 ABC transporter related protein [Conexibacter woesei DSM 14684]
MSARSSPGGSDAAPALEVRRLTASYGARPVLWDVDASFPAGSLSAIVGPNGAGKSTLLKAALGLIPSDAGQALVAGRPIGAARDQVAYVPQRDAVDWDFPITVREVVEMGRYASTGWFRRVPRRDAMLVDDCLERVGMSAYRGRQIGQLSGGQRQRVFIARALAQQAPLLLMDEPFAGVDARTEASILELLGELRDEGRTVVVVHHDLGTVRGAFDWALLLNVRAVAEGPVADVITKETLARAYGAGAASVGVDGEEALSWAG